MPSSAPESVDQDPDPTARGKDPVARGKDPIARALRASARLALWSSLGATAVAALLLQRYAPLEPPPELLAAIAAERELWAGIDFAARPEVRLLQDYVRIDTSHPDPDELAGAEFLAARLAEAGVPATIERFGGRQANLWAIVEGRRREAVVLHSHLDVEPALESEGWKHPPFEARVEGPWIYGRGIYDMKSLAIAQLIAVLDVARRPEPPEWSLMLLATSGEETGSELGTRRLLARHPELVERMAVVLTEGGVVEALGPREVKYWGIEFAQKRYGRLDLCSSDRARLEELRAFLIDEGKGEPRLPLAEPVRAFLEAYAPTRGAEFYRRRLADLERTYADPRRFAQLSPFLRSLAIDELFPFPVEASPEGGYRIRAYLQLLPGSDPEATLAELLPEAATFGVARGPFEVLGADAASPPDHPAFQALAEETRAAHPGVAVGPYFLPWAATDARFFRGAGFPTYGYSPFLIPATDTMNVARANERMALPGFLSGVELYRAAVDRLLETLANDTSSERP